MICIFVIRLYSNMLACIVDEITNNYKLSPFNGLSQMKFHWFPEMRFKFLSKWCFTIAHFPIEDIRFFGRKAEKNLIVSIKPDLFSNWTEKREMNWIGIVDSIIFIIDFELL